MTKLMRTAAYWLVLFTACTFSPPASAQNATSRFKTELDSLMLDMRALWGEMDRFTPQQRYCQPPYAPLKQPDEMLMAAFTARTEMLNARFNALKQSLNDFLAGNPRLYAELLVDGVDPRNDRWWTRWEASRKKMVDERTRKSNLLGNAPVIDCAPQPKPKPALAVAVAAPLPMRPQVPALDWPALPKQFCTWDEYWKFINEVINPRYLRAAENLEKAAKFRSQVEQRVNDHVQQGTPVPPALAALRRQAIADVTQMQRLSDESERIRRAAKDIPVVDCAKKPPPPPQPPLTPLDERRAADQQKMIGEVETSIGDVERKRRAGDCSGAARAYDHASELLVLFRAFQGFPQSTLDELRRQLAEADNIPCGPSRTQTREPQLQPPPESILDSIEPKDPRMRTLLQEHNQERASVGSKPLSWDPALAESAQRYANVMAQTGQLVHSPREGRGAARENLSQGLRGWNPHQMIANWRKERAKFRPGVYPNVSTTGNWEDVSHYTQMVWPATTKVGCGIAEGRGFQWMVCHYTPGGNKDGVFISNDSADPRNGTRIADGPPAPRPGPTLDPRELSRVKVGGGMQLIDPPAGTPPPPPPTAADPAPNGDESRHPLIDYFNRAAIHHEEALRKGDVAGQADALARMHYALEQMQKRVQDARRAGSRSKVDANRMRDIFERFNQRYREANEKSRPAERVPQMGEERG